MKKAFFLIGYFLMTSSCIVKKKVEVLERKGVVENSNKLPVYLYIYPPKPNDSLIEFIKPYWNTRGIKAITQEEQKVLAQDEIARVSSSVLCPPFEQREERVEYIFTHTSFVVNNLGIKLFTSSGNLDSLQWSIYNMPANTKNLRKKELHTFIPTQKKDFYSAFKEFTDTLLISKDYL